MIYSVFTMYKVLYQIFNILNFNKNLIGTHESIQQILVVPSLGNNSE